MGPREAVRQVGWSMEAGNLMRNLIRRYSITPFEAAVAVLLIVSGLSYLFHIGPAQPSEFLLPSWEEYTLNWMSVISGVLLLHGSGAPSRRTEAAGLFLLLAVILSRLIIYLSILTSPGSIMVILIFYTAIIFAAIARLTTIRKGEVIMRIRSKLCI